MIELRSTCPDTEFSVPFLQGMLDRMSVSFHKYGPVSDGYPKRANMMLSGTFHGKASALVKGDLPRATTEAEALADLILKRERGLSEVRATEDAIVAWATGHWQELER